MKKLFVILAVLLAPLVSFAQERPAATADNSIHLAQNQNAPAPAVMSTNPADVPAELASAKGNSASAIALPAKLEGRWFIEANNRRSSNTWSIKQVNGKWFLTWWKMSTQGCGVEDAPLTVKSDAAGTIEISLSNYECMNRLYAKLERNGDGFKVVDGKTDTTRGGGDFSGTLK